MTSYASYSCKPTVEEIDYMVKQLSGIDALRVWPIPDGKIAVGFENAWVKENGCLKHDFGTGSTFPEAVTNYISNIEGKTLVFNPDDSENRREVKIIVLNNLGGK